MLNLKRTATRVGIAAYGANERSAWNLALLHAGATTRVWDIEGAVPSDTLDVWIVVLDTWMSPLKCVRWLRQLNAPTLLISPHVLVALQASEVILYPVLVSSPVAAWDSLPEFITMLLEMTVGKILLYSGMMPYTLL